MMTEQNNRVICLYYGIAAVAGLLLAASLGISMHGSVEGLFLAAILSFAYGISGALLNLRAIGRSAADGIFYGIIAKLVRGFAYIAALVVITFQGIVPEQPFLALALTMWFCYLCADVASVYALSIKSPSQEYC